MKKNLITNDRTSICKLLDFDYPWDIRAEKIINSLKNNNFDVQIVCRNLSQLKTEYIEHSIKYYRVGNFKNKTINYILSFPFFFNFLWIYKLYKAVRDNKCDFILVRDLPLALTGIFIKYIFKTKVVFDMAENYPALLQSDKIKNFISVLIRNHYLAKIVEKIVLKLSDHIFVVVDESKERILNLGINENKITVISNTPIINKKTNQLWEQEGNNKDRLKLLYVGGLELHRGVDFVIRNLQILLEKGIDVEFKIIGNGTYLLEYQKLVELLNLQNHVIFLGYLQFHSILPIMQQSDIGLIPHYKSEHTQTTIPNKLFDYMYAGIPIIATDLKPIKRIINEGKCGLCFKDKNNEEFVNAVMKLTDKTVRKKMGMQGKKLIYSKYNWKFEEFKLLNLFKLLNFL